MPVDERTFAAEIAGWVTEFLNGRPDLPFSRALVEEHVQGTARRHDFRLYRRHTEGLVLTGEIKMPDSAQGNHPLNADLVDDALGKAFEAGVQVLLYLERPPVRAVRLPLARRTVCATQHRGADGRCRPIGQRRRSQETRPGTPSMTSGEASSNGSPTFSADAALSSCHPSTSVSSAGLRAHWKTPSPTPRTLSPGWRALIPSSMDG